MTDRIRARLRGDGRFGRRLGIWCVASVAILGLLVGNLWVKSAPEHMAGGVSLDALRASYARVVPGETAAPDLARLGFDAGRPGVKRLSYLALMEYFVPADSAAFDRLDPAARKCLATPEGCSAYIFRLARERGAQQASFSFVNAAEAANAPGVEVLFLIHDGRVAYKMMSDV